jgi:hydrogenase maturation factor
VTALSEPAPDTVCGSTHCITCGDDGEPMIVVEVDGEQGLALGSDAEGERSTVETALVEPVVAGDRVLVHAGTAIVLLSEDDPG